MYQNSFYPLRTIVGGAIPIEKETSVQKVFESTESKKLGIEYDITLKASLNETQTDPRYSGYLPSFEVDGKTITPGEGVDTLPLPPHPRPFGLNDRVVSFFALSGKKATGDVSRKLSARFLIQLPREFLVGGICFGGYPYLPYSRNEAQAEGRNSSNFGLPREVRLTCLGSKTGDNKDTSLSLEFLDAEISASKQEIICHSGLHFLCIDPTLTSTVTVHFSDYPTILRRAIVDTPNQQYREVGHYGFIIPYFYVFEYREGTRYRPMISAGVLGTTSNRSGGESFKDRFKNLTDHKHVVSYPDGANYFDFTAASVFGQQRSYTVRDKYYDGKEAKGKVKEELDECFVSQKVRPNESVVLYVEQGEEYERCVSGLKLFLPFIPEVSLLEDVKRLTESVKEFYPNSPDFASLIDNAPREELEKYLRQFLKIPKKVNFCERIGIRVYELDPLEGVSPLSVPPGGKYATLLAERGIDELSEISLALFLEGVRFSRPSNSRLFAVELTNLDDKAGQFVVKSLRLIQSAHVSIHPRAAKTQQVRTLNFRVIGADLAEDYSFLGSGGFNFSIERLVAGERKSVLYRANSLLDLLHTGAAKIFSNARRRGIEFERVIHNRGISNDKDLGEGSTNYDIRRSEVSDYGWRRSETGSNVNSTPVTGAPEWYGEMPNWDGEQNPNVAGEKNAVFGFSTLGSREIRSHLQHLLPELTSSGNNSNEWNAVFNYFNFLGGLSTLGLGGPLIPLTNFRRLDSNGWANRAWIGGTAPKVRGQKSVSFNPMVPLLDLTNFIDDIIQQRPFDGTILGNFLFGSAPLLLSGGANTSVGFLGVVTIGMQPIPILNFTGTVGSAGSITKTASEEIYSYTQHLNRSFAQGRVVSYSDEGNQNRVVIRKEVPGTDRQRVRGAEVMWQGEVVDIITGAIPVNMTLPATGGKMHFRTSDDSLRVRFGSGVGKSISVDFWFDLTEEFIRDDY